MSMVDTALAALSVNRTPTDRAQETGTLNQAIEKTRVESHVIRDVLYRLTLLLRCNVVDESYPTDGSNGSSVAA